MFPVSFACLNIIYWSYYLTKSATPKHKDVDI